MGSRDRMKMSRFQCHSKLIIRPLLRSRQLSLTLQHDHHSAYFDKALSPEVHSLILSRLHLTPSEIYHGIEESLLPGADSVMPQQVYYQWQKANQGIWRLHDDQIESVKRLLASEENRNKYFLRSFEINKLKGVAFYVQESIEALKKSKELAMDATYGTNSSGMELFAVLAELDGTGVPLAYMFVAKENRHSTEPKVAESSPFDMAQILREFLLPLKEMGFGPLFFWQ